MRALLEKLADCFDRPSMESHLPVEFGERIPGFGTRQIAASTKKTNCASVSPQVGYRILLGLTCIILRDLSSH
jgi:hypothetical protein